MGARGVVGITHLARGTAVVGRVVHGVELHVERLVLHREASVLVQEPRAKAHALIVREVARDARVGERRVGQRGRQTELHGARTTGTRITRELRRHGERLRLCERDSAQRHESGDSEHETTAHVDELGWGWATHTHTGAERGRARGRVERRRRATSHRRRTRCSVAQSSCAALPDALNERAHYCVDPGSGATLILHLRPWLLYG